MKTILALGTVLAVVLVPIASARSNARVNRSMLPLRKSELGSAAKSLQLQRDSGVLNNPPNCGLDPPVRPNLSGVACGLAKLGRITGYTLDYGLGASGGAGVTEVRTAVDQYKTSAGAKKGLAVWRSSDRARTPFTGGGGGLSAAIKRVKVAAVGGRRVAFLVSYRAANIAPLFGLDEHFTEGRYEARVTVWAGTAAAARKLAPTLAKKLDARIEQAVAGKLYAKPVKLPPPRKPGPPKGGPDLASLALKTTDLNGPAAEPGPGQGYFGSYDPTILSEYVVGMAPAGQFDTLLQQIVWYPTANLARFKADFFSLAFACAGRADCSQLDLSSVGDGARGVISSNDATLLFSSGQVVEYLGVSSQNGVQASEVKNVAQTVANYIDNAGLGSHTGRRS